MNLIENFINNFDRLVADSKHSQQSRVLKQRLAFGKKLKQNLESENLPTSKTATVFRLFMQPDHKVKND